MQKTFVLGFAGQIASGKTARCQHLFNLAKNRASSSKKFLQPHMINGDKVGHKVYAPGTVAYVKILDKFGLDVLGDGKLPMPLGDLRSRVAAGEDLADDESLPVIDRKVLGKIVFADASHMQLLNSIVWPAMDQELLLTIEDCSNTSTLHGYQHCLVILEAAIMVESGFFKHCDDVWLFTCDDAVAIERLRARDGLSEEAARQRLSAQRGVEQRVAYMQRSGFSGGTRVFDTSKATDLEQGLKDVSHAFDEWWEQRARPLLERR